MTYKEAIEFLYDQLPAYQRIGKAAFKKDLTNIRALCSLLEEPHTKFRSIHIAGTNGKGSVAHMLASVLQEAGYTVGLYTSPHLVDFRERIKVNGLMIPKNSVLFFLKRVQSSLQTIQPSFFEITVAMAFDHFRRKKVDIAIVETGLGGRLDSTNILSPELSVITNIGLDHQIMLGKTIPEIAGEKAGIIKPNTPVLIGQKQKETSKVFREAASSVHANLYYSSDLLECLENKYANGRRTLKMKLLSAGEIFSFSPDLASSYQVANSMTAISAILQLTRTGRYRVSRKALQKGMENVVGNTGFAGRWQVLSREPLVIIDGAHNEPGLKQAVIQLKEEGRKDIRIVYGCVNDKDLNMILGILPHRAKYYLTQPAVQRALPLNDLEAAFKKNGKKVAFVSTDPVECLSVSQQGADSSSIILVTGSLFLVGAFV